MNISHFKKFHLFFHFFGWYLTNKWSLHQESPIFLKKYVTCHIVALPFTLKSILKQKKNYENSNISPCKNIILKKNPLNEIKILQNIITITNFKFQHKPKYHLSKILI
jgi:hypothetical protein